MIKEFIQRIYRSANMSKRKNRQIVAEQVETISIEEHNKLKQALEESHNTVVTLEKANQDIINQNDVTLAETERLESDIRVLKIKSILDATTLSDAEKEKQLQVLPGSNLSIEFIQDTFEPITKTKKNNIVVGTKLPQKSVPDKEFSYYT